MKNIRKEIQVVSKLCETILQWRLEHSESLGQRLKTTLKKIRRMCEHNIFEEGIVEMLVSRESFQIKEKLMKALQEEERNEQSLEIEIHITATRKRNCEIYNEELWQFGIFLEKENKEKKIDSTEGIVHLIEHVLKHLECSSLLPLNREQKNKFLINYKVSLTKVDKQLEAIKFENMSFFQAMVARDDGMSLRRLASQFYYNDSKIQESLKEMIMERSLENSGSSKKYSTGSTQGSIRISFYEHYDEELDVTLLSNEEIHENSGDMRDDEFQLLIEETVSEDLLFFNENASLFEKLLQFNYL